MDARTVLALWADDLDLDLTHGNAAELFDLFKKHGYQIIHHDENHGPTRERAAEWHEAEAKRLGPDSAFSRLHRSCAAALRSMEVKYHG